MNLIALRITGPRTRQQYLEQRRNPRPDPRGRLSGSASSSRTRSDLAEAYHRPWRRCSGHGRFEAVYIAGDEREQVHNLSKARQTPPGLGPQGQRLLNSECRVAPSLSPQSTET